MPQLWKLTCVCHACLCMKITGLTWIYLCARFSDSSRDSSGPFLIISLSIKANKHGDDAEQSRIMSACVFPNKLDSCLVVWFNKHSHRTDFPNDAGNTEQVHGLLFSLLPVLFETCLLCAFPTWSIRARLRKNILLTILRIKSKFRD